MGKAHGKFTHLNPMVYCMLLSYPLQMAPSKVFNGEPSEKSMSTTNNPNMAEESKNSTKKLGGLSEFIDTKTSDVDPKSKASYALSTRPKRAPSGPVPSGREWQG